MTTRHHRDKKPGDFPDGSRPRRAPFASVEHLSLEAVAAFVDDELSPGADHRARAHLMQCDQCRDEVLHQRAASEALRDCNATPEVCAPNDLLAKLRDIAAAPVPPGPDADSTPLPKPESLLDVIETMIRAARRHHGLNGR